MKIISVLFAPDWAIIPLIVLIVIPLVFRWAIKQRKKMDDDEPVD